MNFTFGNFRLDADRRTLRKNGETIPLLSRPFDILVLLIQERDRVVTREEIQAKVWRDQITTANNLTVHISALRRVLGQHGAGEAIITVPGRGYRFVAEVTECPGPAPAADAVQPTESEPTPEAPAPKPRRQLAMILAGTALVLAIGTIWRLTAAPPSAMTALVRVAVEPDEIRIEPGRERPVDYVFTIQNQVGLQLETEDFAFQLPSGERVGVAINGGRIWGGSFPIRGGTTATYHNNIYLPPDVGQAGRTRGAGIVLLKHTFHLRDSRGNSITVPAVLMVGVGGDAFPAHVQVETVPDTVTMAPNGACTVDYVFRVLDPTDLQLATEDFSFSLTSGEPIGLPSVGGRIYQGSFPITGGGTGVYHNHIWLPPAVAAAARASNRDEVYLRHSFHLTDPRGTEIIVPAVLKIVFGPSDQACHVPAGR
jgi:DNA-binding winged helix-turn-helix (wHTH) protein